MPKTNKESADSQAGSSENKAEELIQGGPSANEPGGKPAGKIDEVEIKDEVDLENYVEKSQYKEAEKKIGEQGAELGDFRTFFKEIGPLLDKLQEQPDLVEAIMDGKIDSALAEAVMSNKVKIEDATIVADAHEDIKKTLGDKKYKETSPQDIEKLVEKQVKEQIAKAEKTLKSNIDSIDERKNFESNVNDFVENTPDYAEYADGIVKWLDEHPDQYDIEIAYDAVKGKTLTAAAQKGEDINAAEAQKNLAANAAGGQSQGAQIIQGGDIADSLIVGRSNPNAL